MSALPLFFSGGAPAPAWMCPTCAKPWMDEFAASSCCPSMALLDHVDLSGAVRPERPIPSGGDLGANYVLTLDTSAADPASTYVPIDDDPLDEIRTIPLEPADENDRPLYEAMIGVPDGGNVDRPVLERYAEAMRQKLTRRQLAMLRVWLASRHNRYHRRAEAAGLPLEVLQECDAILRRRGAPAGEVP